MLVNYRKNSEPNQAESLGPGSLTPALALCVVKALLWLGVGKQERMLAGIQVPWGFSLMVAWPCKVTLLGHSPTCQIRITHSAYGLVLRTNGINSVKDEGL